MRVKSARIVHIVLVSYCQLVRDVAAAARCLLQKTLEVLISVLLLHLCFVAFIWVHSDVLTRKLLLALILLVT